MTTSEPDFLYANAPLIEVIAELRWDLIGLASMPGAGIDPLFEILRPRISERLASLGFNSVERVSPEQVPIEFVGGAPVFRFRQGPNQWPLHQLGPGLFTSNIVPPYDGWQAFRGVISAGHAALIDSLPTGVSDLKGLKPKLTYIDGFTGKHEYSPASNFVANQLNIGFSLPEALLSDSAAAERDIQSTFNLSFALKSPPAARLSVACAQGLKDGNNALLMELNTIATSAFAATNADDLLSWMDAAHVMLHDAFEHLTSDSLKKVMGPKLPVRPST